MWDDLFSVLGRYSVDDAMHVVDGAHTSVEQALLWIWCLQQTEHDTVVPFQVNQ